MRHHRRGLRRLLRDDALLEAILADYQTAPLSPRRARMLDYAVKLTRTPAAMQRADVERLRTVGFADVDILGIVEVTAYYAYANRIADGLGLAVESYVGADEAALR